MKPDFNFSSSHCNETIYPYVYNLTSSYTDQRNEASMMATSVVMFVLAALFFNLNLFSRFSDVSAILNPSVRLFLSTSLSLFLPVMSYLFSEAKNEGAATTASDQLKTELSLRARTILMWMLLVELLRKKVEAILVNVGVQSYSGTIDRAARIAWLGYLVFFNLGSTGKKAIYGILWVLAAAKLVQRVAINELLKRSFAYGKNAQLLNSYMAQMLQQAQEQQMQNVPDGSELLKRCNYAVMGEEDLERKAGPRGYHLKLKETIANTDANADADSTTVTVGRIWRLADAEKEDGLLKKDPRLKRLCLSFALYKLLRRRFEDLPITDAETHNCRQLIFEGLCKEAAGEQDAEAALFQVFNEELQFLCEYYHSVLPVVLANPFFFVLNYILFPIVVWALCILTIILCGNGNVFYAFQSIASDNYTVSTGIMRMAVCLLRRIAHSPEALFTTVDLGITLLLLLTFLYEEVWEFLVFILSNWFMVSLICDYTAEPRWRDSPVLRGIIRRILWVRNKMSHTNLCFKQFSILGFCRLFSLTLPTKAVPKEVKKSIMEYLVDLVPQIDDHAGDVAPLRLSNGWFTLQLEKHRQYRDRLSWACESESVAEVILTWHIATSLLEETYPLQKRTSPEPKRKVASTLSKYCAYLVALSPELLPDDKDGTERTYKDVEEELKKEMKCWRYYLSRQDTRYDKLMEMARQQKAAEATTVARKGARLGKILIDEAEENDSRVRVWELLADLWTEVMVYVAPSSGEVHAKAHKEALAKGGEFITVLWALATHTGITRPAIKPWAVTTWPSSRVIPVQQVIPVLHVDDLGAASVPSACV